MSVFAFLTFVLLCIETFTRFRRPGFRIVQWTLDTILVVDMYVDMYLKNCKKTSISYSFLDILRCTTATTARIKGPHF